VGEASLDEYRAVLRTLTYQHVGTTGDPDTGIRTITVTPYSPLSEQGVADSVMVAFTAVNNAPVVDLNGPLPGLNHTVFFLEESPEPVLLADAGATITDVDSENLTYTSIQLLNAPDGDLEYISIQTTTLNLVAQSGSAIELTGHPSPISEFVAALSMLTYHNLADEPDPATRTVTVGVYDEDQVGYAQVDIIITPQNDAPEVTLNSLEVVYVEEGIVSIASGVVIVDPDSSIVGYRIRPVQIFDGDVISGPHLSFVQESGIYVAAFHHMSPEDVAVILEEVAFTSIDPEPIDSSRVLCISVQDAEMVWSVEACVTVTVQTVVSPGCAGGA
jgi:hypothetical protein